MLRTTLLLSLALVALPSCKKKDTTDKPAVSDKGTAETTPPPTAPTAPTPAPVAGDQPAAAGTPVATNPKDLFAEFTKPGGDAMALIDKYHAGATFTGKVKTVGAEQVFLDVDGKNMISTQFTDPAAMKAKNLKAGDSVTVTCKIGGASDNLMMVTDCVLK